MIEDEARGYLYEIAERWMESNLERQVRLYLSGETSLPEAAKNCGLEIEAFQAVLEEERQQRAAEEEDDEDFEDDDDFDDEDEDEQQDQ